jgi:CYTH domain-containing protein
VEEGGKVSDEMKRDSEGMVVVEVEEQTNHGQIFVPKFVGPLMHHMGSYGAQPSLYTPCSMY